METSGLPSPAGVQSQQNTQRLTLIRKWLAYKLRIIINKLLQQK